MGNNFFSSESSLKVASEADTGKSFPLANTFSFKIEDKKHRMHRFISGKQKSLSLFTKETVSLLCVGTHMESF